MIEAQETKKFRRIPSQVRAEWKRAEREGREQSLGTVKEAYKAIHDSFDIVIVTLNGLIAIFHGRQDPLVKLTRAASRDFRRDGLAKTFERVDEEAAHIERDASYVDSLGYPASAAEIRTLCTKLLATAADLQRRTAAE